MKQIIRRTAGVAAAVAVAALVATGCSDDNDDSSSSTTPSASASVAAGETTTSGDSTESADASGGSEAGAADVELTAADGSTVTLTGPIAAKYQAATDAQKKDLGAPLTGEDGAGTSDNGVVFQQFDGGVITAKNDSADTAAYITWGKIRDAWNVPRDAAGAPAEDGKGGSTGPLGAATSDETEKDGVKESTFEHGTITWDPATDTVEVTVNGTVVPSE